MAPSIHNGPPGPPAPPAPRPPARWEPFRELEQMRARLDRLVESFGRGFADGEDGAAWSPLADVEETEQVWVVKAELPGVRRDDVTVELHDGELRIYGELDEEKQREGAPHQRMRRMGRFDYSTTLPGEVYADGIEATLDNGVLTVRVPRPEPTRSRRIEVKSGQR